MFSLPGQLEPWFLQGSFLGPFPIRPKPAPLGALAQSVCSWVLKGGFFEELLEWFPEGP